MGLLIQIVEARQVNSSAWVKAIYLRHTKIKLWIQLYHTTRV